jgi:hypothetical protein
MITKTKNLVALSIPSLSAIIAVEMMNVLMYQFSPIKNSNYCLIGWLLLQSIAGFIFATFSDKHYRKLVLVISQIFGVIVGIILYMFHLEIWIIVLIALFFNPLPVARAALLDNFPNVSSLRILGITYFAQYLPWFFFEYIIKYNYKNTTLFILTILSVNIFFTLLFFKDSYDQRQKSNKKSIFIPILVLVLLAYIFAETSFYIEWDFLEYQPTYKHWFTPATLGTLLGICVAMMYSKLPHISSITLSYFLGVATIAMTIFLCFSSQDSSKTILVKSMSQYSIIGGLYLPFVADVVIKIVGSKRRALGSALIEFCAVFATTGAWFLAYRTVSI